MDLGTLLINADPVRCEILGGVNTCDRCSNHACDPNPT